MWSCKWEVTNIWIIFGSKSESENVKNGSKNFLSCLFSTHLNICVNLSARVFKDLLKSFQGVRYVENDQIGFWHPFLGSTGLTLSEMAMLKLIRYLKIIGKATVAVMELLFISNLYSKGKLALKNVDFCQKFPKVLIWLCRHLQIIILLFPEAEICQNWLKLAFDSCLEGKL